MPRSVNAHGKHIIVLAKGRSFNSDWLNQKQTSRRKGVCAANGVGWSASSAATLAELSCPRGWHAKTQSAYDLGTDHVCPGCLVEWCAVRERPKDPVGLQPWD